ncbi:MAG: SRPBCC family protein [Nitriliruptoraceae bacterium]|nr:SRPBCC family protein [Nitriliruptoraceae bacterium]
MTASTTQAWAALLDLESWAAWWPAISDATLVDDPGGRTAAALRFDTPRPIPPLVVTLTVVDERVEERLDIAITDGPMRGRGVVTMQAQDAGCRLHYDIELRVRSLLFKPLEPVLGQATRRAGRERLARAGADLATLAGGQLVDSS